MNEDHVRIQELMAGYVLDGLSGEDAVEADRLLSEHVPSCPLCRDQLAGFQAVAGDLALAVSPAQPPDLLLPRIRRGVAETVRRRRRASLVAVAAGVAAIVGLAGLSVQLGGRVSRTEQQRGRLLAAMEVLQQPGANPVSLESQGQTAAGLVEVSGPGLELMYVIGTDVPMPSPGRMYQLWLGTNGTFVRVEDGQFVPEDGLVLLELTVDTARYDEILVTEERMGDAPASPSHSGHTWHAFLERPRAA
ncbi:MAG TPA: anti-sigma factor [Actinomycetota bacterium]|nr:anti-sigma factor [Actinomycetota bacterium]